MGYLKVMDTLLFQFAAVILFATTVGIIGRNLKLPLVLAYLMSGLLISVVELGHGPVHEVLSVFSSMGVVFLLFLIGIELNITELRTVGLPSIIIGLGQVVFTAVSGFLLGLLLGYDTVTALIVALGLTFSSTIIAVKLLATLGDMHSLYGRISIGILLVQDFVAIFVLIFLSLLSNTQGATVSETVVIIVETFAKLGLLLTLTYIFVFAGKRIFGYLAKLSQQEESTELFLLGTISWVLSFTAISSFLGLSLEIGAFLAGLSLSGTGYSLEIVAKVKPFRDFFIILFFVLLGSEVSFSSLQSVLLPGILFSLLVFLGNPLVVQFVMKHLGYSQQTNFLTGLTLSQIGEFSLIFTAGAVSAGLVDNQVTSVIAIVTIVTVTLSSYSVLNGQVLYGFLKKPLAFLARPNRVRKSTGKVQKSLFTNHVVMIGVGRVGEYIQKRLETMDVPIFMIDYDPVRVEEISKELAVKDDVVAKIIYGDVTDTDLFDEIGLSEARLVISTINHISDNLIVAEEVKRRNPEIELWALADYSDDVELLEGAGVDYVIWTHEVARKHITRKLKGIYGKKKKG